jgi:hypothetical protein
LFSASSAASNPKFKTYVPPQRPDAQIVADLYSPNCCVSVHIGNSIIADFDKGVQMDIGVASLLVVSDTLFRSNKTGVNLSVGGVEHMGASITRSRFEKNDVGLLTFTGNSVTVSNSTTAANFIAFETQAGGNLDVVNSTITKNHTGVKSTGDTSRSLTARSPEILREYRRAVGQSDRWATTRSSTTTSTSPERKTSSHSCHGNDE